MSAERRRALVDAAKAVCAECGGRYWPDLKLPLSGPNEASNYVHVNSVYVPPLITLCAASSIWGLMAHEWDVAEVARCSPRGWREQRVRVALTLMRDTLSDDDDRQHPVLGERRLAIIQGLQRAADTLVDAIHARKS